MYGLLNRVYYLIILLSLVSSLYAFLKAQLKESHLQTRFKYNKLYTMYPRINTFLSVPISQPLRNTKQINTVTCRVLNTVIKPLIMYTI